MNYLSKIPLKIVFLLGCCAVLLSTCEAPSTNLKTEPLLAPHPKGTITPTKEPRYEEQWYLHNTDGIDINIAPVWQKGWGTKPISVGILDGTIDTAHPDLKDNIITIAEEAEGFAPYNAKDSHGTNVAGLLAARDNGEGIIGVAPRARMYGYGVLPSDTDALLTKALKRPEHKTIAVYNASFGSTYEHIYTKLNPSLKEAMDTVTTSGFYGRGSSLVFAAGNNGLIGSASNDGHLNHHAVIAVNALASDGIIKRSTYYSTKGVNIWITAPAGGTDGGMITTNNKGGYTKDFGKTSAAAPLVSGAIALLRSEYPQLTWRDIKLIVAESAGKYDYEGRAQYQMSGTMYSDGSTQQEHSRKMGFGLLDVDAAFALAEGWTLLPPMKTCTATQNSPLAIPSKEKHTSTLTVGASNIQFIESVTIEMDIAATEASKGIQFHTLTLIDPDGKEAPIFIGVDFALGGSKTPFPVSGERITFVVNSFLGSASVAGDWTLVIQQKQKDTTNKITRWSLTFRGH